MKIQPQTWGYSPLIRDNGGRLPFDAVAGGKTHATVQDLTVAVAKAFPALDQNAVVTLASELFTEMAKGPGIPRGSWNKTEKKLFQRADKMLAVMNQTGGAWGSRAMARRMAAGQGVAISPYAFGASPSPFMPYQTAIPQMMGGGGVGRTLMGMAKQIPVLGNLLNGLDFAKDLVKLIASPFTSVSALKAGSDLLYHGIGMFSRQVGASYDLTQGMMGNYPGGMYSPSYGLPNFTPNFGGYAPMYPNLGNMYGYPSPAAYPGAGYPTAGYPTAGYPMQGYPMQGYPMQGYPMQGYPMQGYPMQGYPMQGYPTGGGYSPPLQPNAVDNAMGHAVARTAVGAAKFIPGVGNVLNGLDAVRDVWHIVKGIFSPKTSALKATADLLFHAIGTFVPMVGGAYDVVQGGARMLGNGVRAAAQDQAFAQRFNPYLSQLPAFTPNWGGYAPMGAW